MSKKKPPQDAKPTTRSSKRNSSNPLAQIDGWQVATPEEIVNLLRRTCNSSEQRSTSLWANQGTISSLDLYCYLKHRFGLPQGLAMPFRSPSTQNFIQWNYTLSAKGILIDILGKNDRTEIAVHWSQEITPRQWKGFERRLQKEIAVHTREINQVKSSLERWILFINPYRRLDVITAVLEERIRKLDLTEPPHQIVAAFRTDEDVTHLSNQRAKYVEQLFEAQLLGLSMRMIVPVLAEAFVNLLLFLLAKPEIRADNRLYQSLLRNQIDVRVKGLPVYCVGFRKQVDGGRDEFKDFCRLMDSRNELLHGNIDPTKLVFDEVSFDQRTIPLFKDETNLFHRLLSKSIKYIEPMTALNDLQVARRFIVFILGQLEPSCRKQVEAIMANAHPGWNTKEGRVGLLFPDTLVDIIPIISEKSNK